MKDVMKRVLVIAYVFPPVAYAGTHRTLRLCKHLARMGYTIDVLTIDIQDDLHNDFQLLESIQNDLTIVRTPIRDPHRLHRKSKVSLGNSRIGKLGAAMIGRAADVVSKPDHMVYWLFSAFRPALRMVKQNRYDIVYTTSPPHSEQILGYLLKKLVPSTKWVADMRDPVLDNLMIDKIGTTNKMIHKWLERTIATHADAIVFNTKYAVDCFEQRYHNGRARLIRNSYDESNFEIDPIEKYDRFTIAHVGSIYSFRNVDPLFLAVARLQRDGVIDGSKFRLLFVGMNDASLKAKVQKFEMERLVEIQGMIPHQQAIESMLRSHLLLLVKGVGQNSGSQIPGKLYEYLAAGNPILHIGPTESEAAEIIDMQAAGSTFNENTDDLASFIKENYQRFLTNLQPRITSRQNREDFSSRNMARQMRQLFASL
jgi:glycosyltransferase involved in cell wall biosynthesis